MRLTLIILAFVLIAVPLAIASEIQIDTFSSNMYNLGDELFISGSAKVDKTEMGSLTLSYSCGDQLGALAKKTLYLDKNKANLFSEKLTIKPWGATGECTAKAVLKDSAGSTIAEKESAKFTVTSDLRGTFENSKSNFQLGEKFNINGLISRFDNSPISGSATIYFKNEGEVFFLDVVSVANGELKYTKDLTLIPKGSYSVDVEVTDNYGNKHNFEGLYTIGVSGDIILNTEIDRTSYKPGEIVRITGTVSGNVAESLGTLDIVLNVGEGGETTTNALPGGSFSFSYAVPSDMKSGEHAFSIVAKDDKGNYGTDEGKFIVDSVANTLALTLDKEEYIPGDKVEFTLDMKDQASDLYDGSVLVKFYDAKEIFIESQQLNANTKGSFTLPVDAEPGNWKVIAEGFMLSADADVVVKEYTNLGVEVEGRMMNVTNIGNVPFSDYLILKAGDVEAKKFLNLKIGDETEVSLTKLFGSGNYSIYLPLIDKTFDVELDNVGLLTGVGDSLNDATGNVVARAGLPGRTALLAVLFIVILVALVFIFKPKAVEDNGFMSGLKNKFSSKAKKQQAEQRVKDLEAGRKKLAELKNKGIRKEGINYKATEDDMRDFKERITKQVQEEEAKIQNKARTQGSLGTLFGRN